MLDLDDGDQILRLVGVVLVVALAVAVGVLALNFDPPADDPSPDGNWSVERVNESHIQITRTDGEPIPADEMQLAIDGVQRNVDWTDPVVPGASITVTANEGVRVRVVWAGGRGNRATLETWRV
jgi:hypothetical protein